MKESNLKKNVQVYFDTTKDSGLPRGWLDEEPENFSAELVDQEGGGEGGAEYCWAVYKCTDSTDEALYVRCAGRYYSFVGTEYHGDWKFVTPRQVTVTQYG